MANCHKGDRSWSPFSFLGQLEEVHDLGSEYKNKKNMTKREVDLKRGARIEKSTNKCCCRCQGDVRRTSSTSRGRPIGLGSRASSQRRTCQQHNLHKHQ